MADLPTKERIILAAEELMLAKGFHSVGLTELLKAVKVPKGSFYHHFESKEHFGKEMLRHYIADSSKWKREGVSNPEFGDTPIARLLGFWKEAMDQFIADGCDYPCLVMKLSTELVGYSEDMRQIVADGYVEWVKIFQTCFEKAQEQGELSTDVDAHFEAQFFVDYWYGATDRAVTTRSPEPVLLAYAFVQDRYTKALAP